MAGAIKRQKRPHAQAQPCPAEPVPGRRRLCSALLWLLCLYAALAPFAILRGNHDAANLPQSAFIQVGSLFLLLLWLVAGRPGIGRPRFALPIAALLVWAALSLLWAHNKYEGVLTWMQWTACAVAYFLVTRLVRSEEEARRLLSFLFWSGFLSAGLGILQYLFKVDFVPQAFPPAATFMNRNMAAQFIVAVLPLGAAFLVAGPGHGRIRLAAACGLMVLFLLYAFSRSGLVALTAQAVLLLLAWRWGSRAARPGGRLTLVKAAAALAAILLLANLTPYGFRFRGRQAYERMAEVWRGLGSGGQAAGAGAESFTSAQLRKAIWLNTAVMIKDHPLRGVGLGNHDVYYPLYSRAAEFDRSFSDKSQLDYAHNDYVQATAELGLVGAALLAWLGAVLVSTCRRLLAPDRPLVLAVALSLFGLLIDACFSFPFQRAVPPLVFLVGLGVLDAARAGFGREEAERRTRGWARAAAAGGVFLLMLATAWQQARWIRSDRHILTMLKAERRRDWQAVIAEAEAARRLDPRRKEPLFALGTAYLASGRPREAVAPLSQALAAYPYDMNALGNLGIAHATLGEHGQAQEAYERVLRIKPDDPRVHYHLGELLEAQGRRRPALEEYRLAARFDPGSGLYRFRQGVAALQAGEYKEAREALERAIALQPDLAQAHKALGVLLAEVLGRKAEGIPHLRKALELDPEISDAERIRTILGNPGGY